MPDREVLEALARPTLPAGLERWRLDVPPHTEVASTAAEWAGALVCVERGRLEVDCGEGGARSFGEGDLLALGWLPVKFLRNRGDTAARLIAVRRRDAGAPDGSGAPSPEQWLGWTR